MSNFTICSLCQVHQAEFFCPCSHPEVLLCGTCFLNHGQKCLESEHILRPLNQLPYYKRPGFFSDLKKRKESLQRIRDQLQSEVNTVDQAIAEAEQTAQSIAALFNAKVTELRDFKTCLSASVQASLEEVESTLAEDRPQLGSYFGPALRALTDRPRDFNLLRVRLIIAPVQTWVNLECYVSLPQELLSHSVVEAETQVPAKFPVVWNSTLTLFDPRTQQTSKQQLAVDFGGGGSYQETNRTQLLCIGGDPATTSSYLLDLPSCQLTGLPPLCMPRLAPGTAKAGMYVYVFGGFDDQKTLQSTCEKKSIHNYESSPIGNMHHPRAWFTPCTYHTLIYLIATCSPNYLNVETFCPEIEAFTVLPILLPSDWKFNRRSVAFVVTGELCVLSFNQQMARWKIGVESEFRLGEIDRGCGSTQQPRLDGNWVLIADAGEVVRFYLDTYTFQISN